MRKLTEQEKSERKAVKRIDILKKCVGKRAFTEEKDSDIITGFEFFRLPVGDVMDLVPKEKKFA